MQGLAAREEQLREDQRREALARLAEPASEETLPPASTPAPAQAQAPAPAPEPVRRVEEPKIDPKVLLESAGLVMIETDRSKAPVQPQAEESGQPLGRPRRERPKPAAQDERLEQVETRK
jgi:hypothetical protein